MRSFSGARGLMVCAAVGLFAGMCEAATTEDLVRLARSGKVDAVRQLLDEGLPPDSVDSQGETALGWATFNGHADVVRVLVNQGADVNRKNRHGNPPVIYAAAKGHTEILALLIQRGADCLVRGRSDLTPLVAAARDGHSEAVSLLLNAGKVKAEGHDVALRMARKRGHKSVVDVLVSFFAGGTIKAN